jgi:hypothetical protein
MTDGVHFKKEEIEAELKTGPNQGPLSAHVWRKDLLRDWLTLTTRLAAAEAERDEWQRKSKNNGGAAAVAVEYIAELTTRAEKAEHDRDEWHAQAQIARDARDGQSYELDQARKDIARLTEVQRWISVEERLPTSYHIVWVCNGNVVERGAYNIRNKYWLDDRDNFQLIRVSHWKELENTPQSPEGETK